MQHALPTRRVEFLGLLHHVEQLEGHASLHVWACVSSESGKALYACELGAVLLRLVLGTIGLGARHHHPAQSVPELRRGDLVEARRQDALLRFRLLAAKPRGEPDAHHCRTAHLGRLRVAEE